MSILSKLYCFFSRWFFSINTKDIKALSLIFASILILCLYSISSEIISNTPITSDLIDLKSNILATSSRSPEGEKTLVVIISAWTLYMIISIWGLVRVYYYKGFEDGKASKDKLPDSGFTKTDDVPSPGCSMEGGTKADSTASFKLEDNKSSTLSDSQLPPGEDLCTTSLNIVTVPDETLVTTDCLETFVASNEKLDPIGFLNTVVVSNETSVTVDCPNSEVTSREVLEAIEPLNSEFWYGGLEPFLKVFDGVNIIGTSCIALVSTLLVILILSCLGIITLTMPKFKPIRAMLNK